ncbi:hypothetical protein [Amycolatopsis sp. lyj-108]|uniref:hypothetical protein n=1 Tax=Amycolatopsis sp. lyj-108 TaxID=2789286 RepID=UPI00397A4DEE
MRRERLRARVFVELADTLVDLQGRLRMAAASAERAGLLETLAVQTGDGPCIDCVRDGRPMRLRGMVVGSFTLLHTEPVREDADRPALSQALADVATIGLLQQRAIVRGEVLTEQLQSASARSHDPDMEHANLHLADLSREVADGAADIDAILAHASRSCS